MKTPNPSKIVYFKDYYDSLPEAKKQVIEEGKKYYETLYALREARERLGITQQDLAQKTGIPRETINRIESGKRNVTLEKLIILAHAVKLEVKLVKMLNPKH